MADRRIGWVGSGVMGRSMCMHVLKAGYEVAVYTRTPRTGRRPGGRRRRVVR